MGKFSMPYNSAYAASKFALQALYDSIRAEVAHTKVSVCVVSPGYVKTEIGEKMVSSTGEVRYL